MLLVDAQDDDVDGGWMVERKVGNARWVYVRGTPKEWTGLGDGND